MVLDTCGGAGVVNLAFRGEEAREGHVLTLTLEEKAYRPQEDRGPAVPPPSHPCIGGGWGEVGQARFGLHQDPGSQVGKQRGESVLLPRGFPSFKHLGLESLFQLRDRTLKGKAPLLLPDLLFPQWDF